ncbi:hypothetical protein AW736_17305 [Termitidicoccus mucosus]|uniref:Uncharacterized protein n=1 Tax=Termitidicoccus mucosus TaxID=1184151 RepID=A0A178IFI0_9BACT|nr:hypothetical protein AW736_17305 [Opitutaceae bacterium TSB47]
MKCTQKTDHGSRASASYWCARPGGKMMPCPRRNRSRLPPTRTLPRPSSTKISTYPAQPAGLST